MLSNDVRFEKVEVRRAAAFRPPGFQVDSLAEGINIIFGPNASGKTTLARSVETLLWPDKPALENAELVARLSYRGEQWHVEVQGARSTRQRDGIPAQDALPLPPSSARDRYYLCLHELLEADNRSFAETIMRESVGGYDVPKAANSLGFTEPNIRSDSLTKAAKNTKTAWHDARQKQEELSHEESRLEELTRKLEEHDDKLKRKSLLEHALRYHATRQAFQAAKAKLEDFPPAMHKLRGDEKDRLQDLRTRRSNAARKRDEAQAIINDSKKEIDASPIPITGLPESLFDTQARRINDLKRLEELQLSLHREFDSAQKRRDASLALIGEGNALSDPGTIDARAIREIHNLALEADKVRGGLQAMRALQDILDGQDTHTSAERVLQALRYLQQWLRSPGPVASTAPEAPSRKSARRVVLICALLIAALGFTLVFLLHVAWCALLLIAGALGWVFWASAPTPLAGAENRRAMFRQEYEKLDITPPRTWNEDAVDERIRELEESHARAVLSDLKSARWKSEQREFDELKAREQKLEHACQALADTLGLSLQEPLKREPADLFWLIKHLQEWQAACADVLAKDAELTTAADQASALRLEIHDALRPFGVLSVDGSAHAHAELETLKRQHSNLRSLLEEVHRAEKDVAAADQELRECDEALEALFLRLDLAIDDDHGLMTLCRQLSSFEENSSDARDKASTFEYEKGRLVAHQGFTEELIEASDSSLSNELNKIEEKLAQRDYLLQERQDIETRIGAAKKSHDVLDKRGAYEDALHTLSSKREKTYAQLIGHHLADFLREETRDRDRPLVFHRANQLFSEITRGRYRLVIEGGDSPQFRAFDEVREIGQNLNELSSGTRVQLLLAVRVAFVEHQERGARLPLILDETLANSDDLRAEAIMEAIERISVSGRQIFYLTAQHDEVAKWRLRLERSTVSSRFIELGSSEGNANYRDIYDDTSLPPAPVMVPPPQGLSHAEYGLRLKVPRRLNPHDPAGAVHLWFLIENTTVLHSVLERGITYWGALKSLQEQGELSINSLTPQLLARIQAGQRALETFTDAWLVGRGKPVTRADLEASGAVSGAFIDEVSERCEELNGDARALLDLLERGDVARFRANKISDLEEFLADRGFLDPRKPLSREELWLRVIGSVSSELDSGVVDDAYLRRLIARATGRDINASKDLPLAEYHG
ncbi:hypothetical protein DL240_14775 [Lujinxingia litoralis]|uniref:Rad50/SbcC-type AAA domain-containing protein n=1 Tax=Lujinxingia litoralis TaxID=2211119 RepID=A0A328C2Q6_9DELT|nr:hypothetical protein [Lujinxingia litoralis]RAL20935.1 hypothetical protein DL240_14775 [Lujinxingia litoralis]